MKRLSVSMLASVLFLGAGLVAASEPDPLREGRQLTEAFYGERTDVIWKRFNEEMKEAIGGEEQLATFARQVRSQFGGETRVTDERVFDHQEYRVYRRTVLFQESGSLPFWVQWAFDDQGRVAGFFVRQAQEAAASEYTDYRTRADLRLPFEGEWYVFWGGRDIEQNYHAISADQRFAYDFLIRRDGSSHAGSGDANEDYHCWGESILAPASGTIVQAVDRWSDNRPGQMDPEHPPGNFVVIDHGQGEFSFLAHLRKGSVAVSEGESVDAGDQVGVCGNSGNSSEPHLHYHLQTSAEFGAGQGLPAQFQAYRADGERVERGEPAQSQVIAPIQ